MFETINTRVDLYVEIILHCSLIHNGAALKLLLILILEIAAMKLNLDTNMNSARVCCEFEEFVDYYAPLQTIHRCPFQRAR
jgi:hypothetical protein